MQDHTGTHTSSLSHTTHIHTPHTPHTHTSPHHTPQTHTTHHTHHTHTPHPYLFGHRQVLETIHYNVVFSCDPNQCTQGWTEVEPHEGIGVSLIPCFLIAIAMVTTLFRGRVHRRRQRVQALPTVHVPYLHTTCTGEGEGEGEGLVVIFGESLVKCG